MSEEEPYITLKEAIAAIEALDFECTFYSQKIIKALAKIAKNRKDEDEHN